MLPTWRDLQAQDVLVLPWGTLGHLGGEFFPWGVELISRQGKDAFLKNDFPLGAEGTFWWGEGGVFREGCFPLRMEISFEELTKPSQWGQGGFLKKGSLLWGDTVVGDDDVLKDQMQHCGERRMGVHQAVQGLPFP